jgi:NADH dehydrogenase
MKGTNSHVRSTAEVGHWNGAPSRSRYRRRALIGLMAGLISSVLLAVTLGDIIAGVLLGILIGAGYGIAFRPVAHAHIDSAMSGAALGIPLWGLLSVILLPLVSGRPLQWTAEGMRELLPELVGWVLYGAALGLIAQVLVDMTFRWLGPEPEPYRLLDEEKTQIVILGGGFAGISTARNLERLFGADPRVAVTLVSDNNALLFTPMLAEVAGSSLEPTHISSPLRTILQRTHVVRGRVVRIDLDERQVLLAADVNPSGSTSTETRELTFDHLVLSLGSLPTYFGMQNVEAQAYPFKTLLDAIAIRNRVIDIFERADREQDLARRRELLAFVIAGGGFAGVELAGALNDFGRGILPYYPGLSSEDLSIILVHAGDRILPELSEELASYALERMTARGVTFMLEKRLTDARLGSVALDSGEVIPCQTLVWTAGSAPNPLLRTLSLDLDRRGAVIVDSRLAVPGHPGLWAVGDCASITDSTGRPCPPTAQFALREARQAAHNIHAILIGRRPAKPFRFRSLGALCVVGHQTACAELKAPFGPKTTVRFSGLIAWLMWRGVYLSKLPGVERKVRVLVDWVMDLFFPRDIVQTIDLTPRVAPTEQESGLLPIVAGSGR